MGMNIGSGGGVATLTILHDGHPLLRESLAETPVAELDDPIGIAEAMERTMVEADGFGLAANQVGLRVRAFAIHLRSGEVMTMFNPRLTPIDGESDLGEEGCLSFPGLYLKVRRLRRVRVQYEKARGQSASMDLDGIDAVCAQHEVDHLDGRVFTSRVSSLVLRMARRRLEKKGR